MKDIERLRLQLNKIIDGLPATENTHGHFPFRDEMRKIVKNFANDCIEAAAKEVYMYGRNTHSADSITAFAIEFRRLV